MTIKENFARWAFRYLSGDSTEHCVPPGAECWLDFGEQDDPQIATTYNNDGFELWLGTPHHWHCFYRGRDARRLAWFILWTWWIKATWCGLKRRVWYWALHSQVRKWKVSR